MRYVKATSVRQGLFLAVVFASFGMLMACGGSSSSSSSSSNNMISTSGQNVQPITVNGGPVPNFVYENAAFTSVTLCAPGTTTCQTIDGILVDTGSFGLRVLSSAVTLSLPTLGTGGSTVNDCVTFVDGSFVFGPVAQADVKLAGETASSISLQMIENPTAYSVPASCANGGTNDDTLSALGANGILGVGPEPEDCGPACDPSTGGASPPVPAYYACSTAAGCQPTFVSVAQQVTNPVVLFTTDNNGVIMELPSASGQEASSSGSLVFGIGTQSNNQLPSSTALFRLDNEDNFTTTLNGQAITGSFLDSGSNALFFPDSSIPTCSDLTFFFCPTSTVSLTATNTGTNGASNQVSFTVGNADQMSGSDAVLPALAGPNSAGFDWGLPFFYGRNVYTAIDGQSTPSGAGPYWAY